MPDTFAILGIDGSFVREMRFVPSKTVHMTLLRAPQSESEIQVTREYDLRFHGVYGFRSSLDAQPWLEIESHKLVSHSEYLSKLSEQRNSTSPPSVNELRHFQIICDEGRIDIIAEHFTSSITDEIPHVGSSVSRQAEENDLHLQESPGLTYGFPHSPAPSDEPVEIRCAFCGRERAEVTKIITGSGANICDDCVLICIGLIRPTPNSTE